MSNGADRRLEVPPERIARWLTGFGERHGGVTEVTAGPDTVRYVAADGSRAECRVPFPPLEGELAEPALRDRRGRVPPAPPRGAAPPPLPAPPPAPPPLR